MWTGEQRVIIGKRRGVIALSTGWFSSEHRATFVASSRDVHGFCSRTSPNAYCVRGSFQMLATVATALLPAA